MALPVYLQYYFVFDYKRYIHLKFSRNHLKINNQYFVTDLVLSQASDLEKRYEFY